MILSQEKNLPENKLLSMALLVALGVILHRVEAVLPLPSPWIKLGLANIVTLLALVFFGFKEALTVALLRILFGSVVGGTFLSPPFFLSLAGGLAGALTMGLVYRSGTGPFSLAGVSVAAAYAHTLVVSLCVYLFFIRQGAFLHLLPVFFTFALLTGLLTGIAANILKNRLVREGVCVR